MSLIKCNECGKKISSEAETCPHCGIKITKKVKKEKPKQPEKSNEIGSKLKNIKNNKTAMIIIGAIIILAIAIPVTLSLTKTKTPLFKDKTKENVTVVKSEATNIKLIDYDGGNFTMKIPQGWKVETGGQDMFYAIRAYNPSDDRYQVYAILKAEPFLKNDKAKAWYQNYYKSFGGNGNKVLAEAIVLYSPTVEAFYSNFNSYTAYTKSVDTMYDSFNFPDLRNFAMIEQFESNSSMKSVSKDDKTIRGTFQDSKNGKNGEGLFMASIVDLGSYNYLGYDTLFYSVYNIMGITTAKNELVNYQEIFTKVLGSIKYTDSFVNTTISNGQEKTKSTLAMNNSMQEAYDSYNSAWSARQTTYDITSQKSSDATLGYERVYDTETGDIYKAYNGFTDDYTGKRYKPITDNMYTEAINGYIER